MVDWLGSTGRNSHEDGTPSKNQSFPRNVHPIEEKSHGQEPHENEKEKSIIIQLFPTDLEFTRGLSRFKSIFLNETQRKGSNIHSQTWELISRKRYIFNKEAIRHQSSTTLRSTALPEQTIPDRRAEVRSKNIYFSGFCRSLESIYL